MISNKTVCLTLLSKASRFVFVFVSVFENCLLNKLPNCDRTNIGNDGKDVINCRVFTTFSRLLGLIRIGLSKSLFMVLHPSEMTFAITTCAASWIMNKIAAFRFQLVNWILLLSDNHTTPCQSFTKSPRKVKEVL